MQSILKRLFRRHTAAVAYLGLFVALSSSAYAATTITGAGIKNDTITGKDVKNGSLGTQDLSSKAVDALTSRPSSQGAPGVTGPSGPKGDRGPAGAAGPKGATGPPGPAGPVGQRGPEGLRGVDGVSGWSYHTAGKSITPGEYEKWTVNCPGGKKALGGGVAASGPFQGNYNRGAVVSSAPAGPATGWAVTYSNGYSQGTMTAYAWVICGYVSS